MERRFFVLASLDYVCMLQEVQERKKFEFVETVSTGAPRCAALGVPSDLGVTLAVGRCDPGGGVGANPPGLGLQGRVTWLLRWVEKLSRVKCDPATLRLTRLTRAAPGLTRLTWGGPVAPPRGCPPAPSVPACQQWLVAAAEPVLICMAVGGGMVRSSSQA